MRSRRTAQIGWLIFALATAYAVALSTYAFVVPGWKPHRVETAWILFAVTALAGLIGRENPPSPPASAAGPRRWWLLPLALAGAVAAYGGALSVGYLSDDFVLLDLRRGVWRHGTAEFVRVLPVALIQAVDRWFPERGAVLLHLIALSLHCLNGVLVHRLARRLALGDTAAAAAAAVFLVFPASVEAVAWISGLQDVMMTSLTLAFVLAALGHRHAGVLLALLAAGLLSKETAAAMPVLAAAVLWAKGAKPPGRVVRTAAITLALAAAFAAWRLTLAGGEAGPPLSRYAVKEVLSGAFGTLALPWSTAELKAMRAYGFLMVAWIVAAAWILIGGPARRESLRVALAGLLWVVVSIAPVNRLFFVSDWLEGSRYLYLASAGWGLAIAAALAAATPLAGRTFAGLTVASLLVWTGSVVGHVRDWQRAAAMRDQVLASAAGTPRPDGCGAVAFVRPPDTVRGAYVFRNGFGQALARAGVSTSTDAAAEACVFAWSGQAFERVR